MDLELWSIPLPLRRFGSFSEESLCEITYNCGERSPRFCFLVADLVKMHGKRKEKGGKIGKMQSDTAGDKT